jgi:hypothetical protein
MIDASKQKTRLMRNVVRLKKLGTTSRIFFKVGLGIFSLRTFAVSDTVVGFFALMITLCPQREQKK